MLEHDLAKLGSELSYQELEMMRGMAEEHEPKGDFQYRYGDDICRMLVDHENERIYITIDGTSSVLDAIRNLFFIKNRRTDCAEAWYPAGESIGKKLSIKLYVGGFHNYSTYFLCKSRGAPVGAVASRYLMSKFSFFNVVECHSLGSPRRGGEKWAKQLQETGIKFFNWRAKGDKVLGLPFKRLGFVENYGVDLDIPKYKGFIRTHLYAYKRYFVNMLRLGK